jgi:hypothetical protein
MEKAQGNCHLLHSIRANHVFDYLVESSHQDWKSLVCVQVNDDLSDMIDRVLSNHPLRGFDCIHLASALILHNAAPEELLFACFDKTLGQAAVAEGLKPLP